MGQEVTPSPREVIPRMATSVPSDLLSSGDRSTPRGISGSLLLLLWADMYQRNFYPQDYPFQGLRVFGVPAYPELRQQLIGHSEASNPATGGEILPSKRS